MDWPRRRGALLAAHAALEARHRELGVGDAGTVSGRQGGQPGLPQLHELREHHEELQEHHGALAEYETALGELPPGDRTALTLATQLEAAEVMLVEAGRAADQAREAWRRATDVYKKVRDLLDREE
jgi:hypothetical protein